MNPALMLLLSQQVRRESGPSFALWGGSPQRGSATDAVDGAQPVAVNLIKGLAPSKECSMQDVVTVGLDIAKNAFQAHGVDAEGGVVFRSSLRRGTPSSAPDYVRSMLSTNGV